MELLLIEGIPGSGKTTLAEMICTNLCAKGINASWYLEEAKNHPVHPHNGKRKYLLPHDYLNQWREFLQHNTSSDQLFILEGSFFQNSVRFLLENNHKEAIPDYFSDWQSLITCLPTKLIYLRPNNVNTHIDWIMQHRGNHWRQKITTYYEQTPFCSSVNCCGEECMHKFWSLYTTVCESLIMQATISTHVINITTDQFSGRFEKALKYVAAG